MNRVRFIISDSLFTGLPHSDFACGEVSPGQVSIR